MRNRNDKPREHRGTMHKGRGGRRQGGRRPRLGRFLAHGDLRFLILKLIEEKPRHGYEIIKAIEEQVAGAYSPSPGVIYPTLTLLEELEWISAIASEGNKKRFEITQDGSLALRANRTTVESIVARMKEVSEAQSDEAAPGGMATDKFKIEPQIRLGLDDLRRAVEHRHTGDPLTKDQIATIVAALSIAASEVERS